MKIRLMKAYDYQILLLLIFISVTMNAQTDWQRWESKEVSFELLNSYKRDYSIDNSGIGTSLLSVTRNAYYFLISDLDGDNCPFFPSCSRFFVDAVKETNIITGMLMFADRFTRDMNPVKGVDHYSLHPNGKYFDPPYNYTLNLQKIKL